VIPRFVRIGAVSIYFAPFRISWLSFLLPPYALPRAEHGALRSLYGCEAREAKGGIQADVDSLHPAADEIGFMPKCGPAGIAHKILPPLLVRQGARLGFERIEISPILPHAHVQREDRIKQGLMDEQS
jgi:hypothetical protein